MLSQKLDAFILAGQSYDDFCLWCNANANKHIIECYNFVCATSRLSYILEVQYYERHV